MSSREMTRLVKMSNVRTGYTKAVDLWALGCISAILLTGDPPFAKPEVPASELSDEDFDMDMLEDNPRWIRLSENAKDFVRDLLVIDEADRPTVFEALNDAWFANEVYKADFDKLYNKSIQHWTPRVLKSPPLEFVDAYLVQSLKCSQDVLRRTKYINDKLPFHSRHKPVEAHYKPFAREMYAYLYSTPTSSHYRRWSPEVLSAIEEYWTPRKANSVHVKPEESVSLPPNNISPVPRPAGLPRRRRSRSHSFSDNHEELSSKMSARRPFQSPLLPKSSRSLPLLENSLSISTRKADLPLHSDTKAFGATAFDPSAWNDGDLPSAYELHAKHSTKSGYNAKKAQRHRDEILSLLARTKDDTNSSVAVQKFPLLLADTQHKHIPSKPPLPTASKAVPMAPPPLPPSTPIRPTAKLKRRATPLSILTSSPSTRTSLPKERRRSDSSIFDILNEDEEDSSHQQQLNDRRPSKAAAAAANIERLLARDDEGYLSELAQHCGLSVDRYVRKLERGEIIFTDDGSPVAISKKDVKKKRNRDESESESDGLVTKRPKLQASHVTNVGDHGRSGVKKDGVIGGAGLEIEEGGEIYLFEEADE